jgi:hypothetical protein
MAFPHESFYIGLCRSRPGLALDEPHPALLYEALLPFLTKEDGEFFDGNLSMGKLQVFPMGHWKIHAESRKIQ